MKIIFPVLNFNKSGGMRIALQYCKGLSDLGKNVILMAPNGNNDKQDLCLNGVKIELLDSSNILKKYFYYIGVIFSFRNKIKKDDIIVATSWQSILIIILNRITFKNIILIIQHDDDIILGNKLNPGTILKKILFRIVYKLPVKKISVSDWLSKHLEHKYNIIVDSISNGIDAGVFFGKEPKVWTPPKDTIDVLCLARSVDWKGFDDFLKASEILYSKIKNIKLIIVSQEEMILNTIVPYVFYKPADDKELGMIYRSSTIFIFPSWIEGFGLPPLEAMSNGIPVITTSCGGITDFAINEFNCLVVDIKAPKQLADAVMRLLNDKNLMKRLSQNGLDTANKFQMNCSIKKLDRIINCI